MAKIPSNITKFESPFRVLEDLDLNYETPKSSIDVQKKLIFSSGSPSERREKVAIWHERFVINKHPLQLTTLGLKTPPLNDFSSCSTFAQPLAPMKHRKLIDKTDLKPKKLIFKDVEETETAFGKFPTTFEIKQDDSIINEQQPKLPIQREKLIAIDEKENQRSLLSYQTKTHSMNISDKVNIFKSEGIKSKYPNNSSNTVLSVTKSQKSQIKNGFKHYRI